MASNQTQHLKLCQWEADDEVLRTDFNADNAKIDAGVAAVQEAAAKAQSAADAAQATADAGYAPGREPFAVGYYIGDGKSTRTISLGFQPSLLLVCPESMTFRSSGAGYSFYYGGIAVPGHGLATTTQGETAWVNGSSIILVTEDGFKTAKFSKDNNSVSVNEPNVRYFYLAFR